MFVVLEYKTNDGIDRGVLKLLRTPFELQIFGLINLLISPTHKQTEGRAPLWGRYTSGGFGRNRCYAERKIVGFGGDWLTGVKMLPAFWNSRAQTSFESIWTFQNNFESSPKNLAWEF
jgi:hypothetical protein